MVLVVLMSAALITTRMYPWLLPGCFVLITFAVIHRNKAVADGAVSYHIDHFVRSRVAKYSYGVEVNTAYDASNPEHLSRPHYVFTNLTGHKRIKGFFDVILRKVKFDLH